MKNINATELLDLHTIRQSFEELMSAMHPSQFVEGLTDIAWVIASSPGEFTKNAPNALFPIMYFFIALAEAEKQTWKDMYHESNPYNGIPRESTQAFTIHHSTLAEATPQTPEGE